MRGVLLLALLIQSSLLHAEWYQQQRDIMGTRASLELWHPEAVVATDCSAKAFAEMRRIEALMSTYQASSEISFINDNAAVSAVNYWKISLFFRDFQRRLRYNLCQHRLCLRLP
jgi:thiamine biosynthesis lipoprotein